MSLKELLAVDCGGRNPLLDAASHLTRDQGLRQDSLRIERGVNYGAEELMVREFLEETKADQETIIRRAPQSFQMNRLLEDLREIESTRQISVRPGPSVSAIARVEPGALWASEFLETVKDTPHAWVDEFQTTALPMAPPLEDVWQSMSHPVPLASDLLQQSEVWTNEFAATSSQPAEQKADEWVAEFTEEKKEDFWEKLEADWQRAALDSPMDLPWLEASAFQQNNDYKFADENPLIDLPDSLQQGKQRRAAGDLPSAVLFFEAAVQKDPTLVEGWLLLGLTLAENEQDPAAVRALNKCLSLDPSVLDARMALAISYTNEGLQMQACKELEDWLAANPKYSQLVPPEGRLVDQRSTVSSLVSGSLYMRLQNMYTEAARLMVDGSVDADVQTGLGALLNLAGEYTKAADCFRAALTVRPNDALLWNRLGATLANGGNSEEAVEAYSTALNLSPGFIRSRYNLAVACVNLRTYREAAEHLVSALNMQASAKAPGRAPNTSDNIWSTLRTVLSMLGRRDLIPDVDKRNIQRLIEEFGS